MSHLIFKCSGAPSKPNEHYGIYRNKTFSFKWVSENLQTNVPRSDNHIFRHSATPTYKTKMRKIYTWQNSKLWDYAYCLQTQIRALRTTILLQKLQKLFSFKRHHILSMYKSTIKIEPTTYNFIDETKNCT